MPFALTLLIFGPDLYLENDQKGRIQTPDSRIRDGEKIQIRIRMNIRDHISESLETIFCVKIHIFFDADPGSGIFLTLDPGSGNRDGKKFGPGIRDKHPGSATLQQTNYSDAQRCLGEVAPLEGANLLYEVRLHVPLSVIKELETDGHREWSREVGRVVSFTGLKQNKKENVRCTYLITIQIVNSRSQIQIPKWIQVLKFDSNY
jgi:hypothetical protein